MAEIKLLLWGRNDDGKLNGTTFISRELASADGVVCTPSRLP